MQDEDYGKTGCALIGGFFILFVAALYAFGVLGLIWDRFASPVREETRTKVYEQSRAYNQGMAIDLDNLCREWRAATGLAKDGLADTIRLRSARYSGELPPHVQACLSEIR